MNFTKLQKKIFALALVVAFVVPISYLVRPPKAQAETASCITGFLTAAAVSLKGAAADLFTSVPAASRQEGLSGFFQSGGSNAITLKECVFKPLAIIMVKGIIRNIGASIVDWINNGFEGSPAFVTDPGRLLMDVADQELGRLIEGSELNFLCEPFRLDIRIALAQFNNRRLTDRTRCTLSSVVGNVEGFATGNNQGGWDNFLAKSVRVENNPYSALLEAQNEVSIRILGRQEIKLKQLNWGNGFLSFEKCETIYNDGAGDIVTNSSTTFSNSTVNGTQTSYSDQNTRKECRTVTPGSAIASKLFSTMNQNDIEMAVAEELDQIIGALMNQIGKTMITGGLGILGLGQANASNGNKSYLQKYRVENYDQLKRDSTAGNAGATSQANELNNIFGQATDQYGNVVQTTGSTNSYEYLNREENLALRQGAITNQSTTNGTYTSEKAIDGNKEGDTNSYGQRASITGYYEEAGSWWQVTLAEAAFVKELRIWRTTSTGILATLGKFKVIAKDINGATVYESAEISSTQELPFVVPVGKVAKTIRIQRTNTDKTEERNNRGNFIRYTYYPLSLAEVEVIGQNNNIVFNPDTINNSLVPAGTDFNYLFKAKSERVTSLFKIKTVLYKGQDKVPYATIFNTLSANVSTGTTTRSYTIPVTSNATVETIFGDEYFIDGLNDVNINYIGSLKSSFVRASTTEGFAKTAQYTLKTELREGDKTIKSHNITFNLKDQ